MRWSSLLLGMLWPLTGRAQIPTSMSKDTVGTAAALTTTITEVTRHLRHLTADSMRRRATPSHALELTAQYVAAEFQRLGLKPGARDLKGQQAWIQRYSIPGQRLVNDTASLMAILVRPRRQGKNVVDASGQSPDQMAYLSFAAAYFAPEAGRQVVAVPSKIAQAGLGSDELNISTQVVVVAGPQTAASVRRAADTLRGNVVVYVPSPEVDSAVRREVIAELYAASQGVLIVSGDDSVSFAAARAAQAAHPSAVMAEQYLPATGSQRDSGHWAIAIWAGQIRTILRAAGADIVSLRAAPASVVQRLSTGVGLLFRPEPMAMTSKLMTAPNIAGVLEGSDSVLRGEYVVLTAHMDNSGNGTDNLAVGADNTAGVAGLLAIAKAFSQPGRQPRRSLLFVATSGGMQEDRWGANAFASYAVQELNNGSSRGMVANLTLDQIGSATGDSLWVDGVGDIAMTMSPAWVAGEHPELDMQVVAGGTAVQPTSDQFAFVRRTVPSLLVHTGEGRWNERVTALDTAYVGRVAQFAFYMTQLIATTDQRPRWSTEGRYRMAAVLP